MRTCATCGEATTVVSPGYITGRACRCERDRQAQAKLDRVKPRCGALMADHSTHEDRCGDHEGHVGAHGQGLITQAMK